MTPTSSASASVSRAWRAVAASARRSRQPASASSPPTSEKRGEPEEDPHEDDEQLGHHVSLRARRRLGDARDPSRILIVPASLTGVESQFVEMR